MKRDPRVRKDGLCALKTCRKPRNPKENRYSGMEPFLDPFCSSDCCREYHDAPRTPPLEVRSRRTPQWDNGNARRRARLKAAGSLPEGHKTSAAQYRNGCRCDGCRVDYRVWQKEMRAKKQEAKAA